MAALLKLLYIVCLRFTGHGYCLEGRTYCQGERYRGNEESRKGGECTLLNWNAETVDDVAVLSHELRQAKRKTVRIERQTEQTQTDRQTDKRRDGQTEQVRTYRQTEQRDGQTKQTDRWTDRTDTDR